jgi:outer membrane protein
MRGWGQEFARTVLAVLALAVADLSAAAAQTLPAVLAKAYHDNPQLNAQRAFVRQTEEQVQVALSGYHPRISATASGGTQYTEDRFRGVDPRRRDRLDGGSVGVTASQTLFDGFRTPNQVEAARGNVEAAREVLRLMAQQILLDAATAYMNVIRDTAIVHLQRHNVEMLESQLSFTRQRLKVREVTTTDVQQTETRLAGARWGLLAAESTLTTSRAAYRRVIGQDQSGRLAPAAPVDRLSPATLKEAMAAALKQNPSIKAAQVGIDVAAVQVKIAEGALYPTAKLDAGVQHGWGVTPQIDRQFAAGAFVTLSVPIYQGGAEYATIRESKEALGQKQFDLDRVRDGVRAGVSESWGQLAAAKAQIDAAQAQVTAAQNALNGVLQEARAGQRTTLDVLNAQQELIGARLTLVATQRDRVVTSYAVLAAVGRLGPEVLRLAGDPKPSPNGARTK